MSYCNINDAFNINSNFENIVRGLNTFNPTNNSIDNIKSGYDNNLNSKNSIYEDQFKNNDNYNISTNFDPMYESNNFNDNMSWESLNGTDLSSNKIENKERKLTHRECINIYNNPDSYKENILYQALKHVSKCKLCKDEIKNMIISNSEKDTNYNTKKQNINLNDLLTESESNLPETILTQSENKKINTNRKNLEDNLINSEKEQNNYLKTNNSKIESELKLLNDKINGESHLKYQNAMLQNNLSKYLEDLEEKKKINYKLDKIMELVNLNLSKTNKLDNLFVNNEYQNKNLLNPINQINSLDSQLSQLQPQISTQILNNLLKLSQQNSLTNQSSSQVSWETYLLYISITVIIFLLIIDIIIRFSSRI